MTLCKANLHHIKYVLVIALALTANACAKKEVYLAEEKKQSGEAQEEVALDTPEKSEVFDPLGVPQIGLRDIDPTSRNRYFDTYKYQTHFYDQANYDLDGKELESIELIEAEEEVKLRDFYGNEVDIEGDFIDPIKFSVSKDLFLNQSTDDKIKVDNYIFSEGKSLLIQEHRLSTLKKLSPDSVVSVENQMLSAEFKPHCYFKTHKEQFKNVDLKLFSKNKDYLLYPRSIVKVSTRDSLKVVISDMIFRDVGRVDMTQPIDDVRAQLKEHALRVLGLLNKKSYMVFLEPEPNDVRLLCVSIFSGDTRINVMKKMLSSVLKNAEPIMSSSGNPQL